MRKCAASVCFSYVAEGAVPVSNRTEKRYIKIMVRSFWWNAYEEKQPDDYRCMLRRYLGSGAIKGVGPALAARIVKRFGEDTLYYHGDVSRNDLAEVKGISEKMAVTHCRSRLTISGRCARQ